MKKRVWRLLPLMVFTLLVIFLWRGLSLEPQHLPSTQIGHSLPEFQLPQLGTEHVFSTQTVTGKVALLNVWASWCEACIEEQVFLMQLAQQGVLIYGLNYKDDTADATRWLKEWGNPYQAIGEDHRGKVAIDLGVYGAPETFLLDSHGIIRYRHVGILDAKSWQQEFLPRIRQLETA